MKNEIDNFINIPFVITNLDRYIARTSIKNALDWSMPSLHGRLLDAGCGGMPYRSYIKNNSKVEEYIGLDIETAIVYEKNVKPDYTWDGVVMPFEDHCFDACMATEVLEHCPDPEIFLREVKRVLKPGSPFFFTVPFLWNLHEVPHDEYRYTPFALERHLQNSGFDTIELRAMGGWHASMAQMLGLWVRRSPMTLRKRNFLSILIKPIMWYLIKRDKKDTPTFLEGQMITGLYGIAKRGSE